MLLITSDDALRQYIPNVLKTVEGEKSLFDKLSAYLESAEMWISSKLLTDAVLTEIAGYPENDKLRHLCAQIVVSEAFREALPSLDVVLTPNGFGIVSNSNVAPASKERIERLAAQLAATRDGCIEKLLPLLPNMPLWLESSRAKFFGGTLFPTMDLPVLVGEEKTTFRKYLELRQKVELIEQSLLFSHIGETLYQGLRKEQLTRSSTSGIRQAAAVRLRNIELSMLDGNNDYAKNLLLDLVDMFKRCPDDFSEWYADGMDKLHINPPHFENKKSSTGYFF